MSNATSHFKIHTRTLGNHDVTAQTACHAVAALVARLKLTEQQTQQVTAWAVVEVDANAQPAQRMFGRGATEAEVSAGDPRVVWCSVCDVAECACHGRDCLVVCEKFHLENIEVKK